MVNRACRYRRSLVDMDESSSAADQHVDLGILLLLAYQGFVRALHRELDAHRLGPLKASDGYVFRALAEGRAASSTWHTVSTCRSRRRRRSSPTWRPARWSGGVPTPTTVAPRSSS